MIMTYQKPTPNYDNAEESSSLFLTVADASPSSLFGQDGVATKKNHGVHMIAVVAIYFFVGTNAVIHQGSSFSNPQSHNYILKNWITKVYEDTQ